MWYLSKYSCVWILIRQFGSFQLSLFFYFLSDSNSFAGTVLKAPKAVGAIVVFTLNCLRNSTVKSMYLSIFSCSFYWTWWSIEIAKSNVPHYNVPLFLLHINQYHIWPIIAHFLISLYWFVSADCYFDIISFSYNIEYMAVPLISCRYPILLEY